MSSTADCYAVKLFNNIEKLKSDSSNWDVWKSTIILILQHHKLLDYIEGSFPKPTPNYPPNTPSPAPLGMSPTNATVIQDWTVRDCVYLCLDIAQEPSCYQNWGATPIMCSTNIHDRVSN